MRQNLNIGKPGIILHQPYLSVKNCMHNNLLTSPQNIQDTYIRALMKELREEAAFQHFVGTEVPLHLQKTISKKPSYCHTNLVTYTPY